MDSAPPFSRRTSWERRTNRLSEVEARARAEDRPLFDLTLSNPTAASLAGAADRDGELLRALADPASAAYVPDPRGLTSLRSAICRYYGDHGLDVAPEALLPTASTSEAYASLLKLLCDDGDRVLVPQPSYPLLDYLARLEDVALDPYPLHHDGTHWWVDLDALAAAVGPRTRAIMVVSPNNPTGSYLKEDEWSALQDIAARHGLAVVVDEVFSDYARGADAGRVPTAAGRPCPALTFVLSGLSKVLGLPQVKLGWIALQGPAAACAEATARLEIVLDTYLSVSTPAQVVAIELLPRWRAWQAPIAARVAANAATLEALLGSAPAVRQLPSEGGWYAVLRLPLTRSEEAWMLAFLEHDRVLVHPGYFFDFPSEAYAVASLLPPEADFREGLGRLLARAAGAP